MSELMYFAYGSNMYSPRLRFRVRPFRVVTIASLSGHALRFHKRSDKDGSGKGDAFRTGNASDLVRGVLYALSDDQLNDLHKFEGRGYGYDDHAIEVLTSDGTAYQAITYLAAPSHILPSLKPYTWYLDFVRRGAQEHRLPDDYVETFINRADSLVDPNAERDAAARAEVRMED